MDYWCNTLLLSSPLNLIEYRRIPPEELSSFLWPVVVNAGRGLCWYFLLFIRLTVAPFGVLPTKDLREVFYHTKADKEKKQYSFNRYPNPPIGPPIPPYTSLPLSNSLWKIGVTDSGIHQGYSTGRNLRKQITVGVPTTPPETHLSQWQYTQDPHFLIPSSLLGGIYKNNHNKFIIGCNISDWFTGIIEKKRENSHIP